MTYIHRKKILTELVQSNDIVNLIISYIQIPKYDKWMHSVIMDDIKYHKQCMDFELYDTFSHMDNIQYVSNFLNDSRKYMFLENDIP
jgi:hypothetical protein